MLFINSLYIYSKLPQIVKIATYAGFADPNFRLQQYAQIFFLIIPKYTYLS